MAKTKVIGETKVAGVTFGSRQGVLANMLRLTRQGQKIYFTLRREKKNKNDTNAILVIAHCNSQKKHIPVGYIPKEKARELAPVMDSKQSVWVYEPDIGYWRFGGKSLLSAKFKYAYYKENIGQE